MNCKQCGAQINDTAQFCETCGTPVVPDREERQVTQPSSGDATVESTTKPHAPRWQLIVLGILAIVCIVLYVRGGEAVQTYFESLPGNIILGVLLITAVKVCWDNIKSGGWRHRPVIILLSVPIAAFCLYLLVPSVPTSSIPRNITHTEPINTVHEALMRQSNQLNRNLPMQINEYTRIDRSRVVGKTLVFDVTLLQQASRELSQQDLYRSLYELQLAKVCKSPNLEVLRRRHITMKYVYFGNDAEKIGAFSIDPAVCK